MEPGQGIHRAMWALLVILGAVAAALGYAYVQKERQAEAAAAAQHEIGRQRDSLQGEVQALRTRAGELEASLASAREQAAALAAEKDKLATEKDKLARGLSETAREAQAAAAARAELSRELQAKEQTLAQAKARSAELNKAYEGLLKDKSRLAASDAAHRAELERTRKSFEEVQALIARLTGARGIYTVQDTDSLSKIAAFFYRDGLRWPDIFKANAHLIDHPDLIYPEQVLIVPH